MDEHPELTPLRARAMEFTHTGIVITDCSQPDNPIIDCNPAFEVITGYTKAEVVGKNCRFLQRKGAGAAALKAIRAAVKDQEHVTVVIKIIARMAACFGTSCRFRRCMTGRAR